MNNTTLEINLSDFLAPFFPNANEEIHLRTFKAKNAPEGDAPPLNWETSREDLNTADTQHHSQNLNQKSGIYFIVNSGGHTDEEIARFNAFFVENDTRTLEEQHEALDGGPLATSIRIETNKSVHAYWLLNGDCTESEWREVQARLIAYFDGDPRIKNPSRCMRLPSFNHVTYNGKDDYSYKPVEVVEFEPTRRYTVAEMLEAFPVATPDVKRQEPNEQSVKVEQVSSSSSESQIYSWDNLNAELKRRIMSHPTAKMQNNGWWHCKGICHNGSGNTAIMFNPATGAVQCMDGCSHAQLLAAFGLPEKPATTSLIFGANKLQRRNVSVNESGNGTLEILIQSPTTDVGNAECMSALYSSVMRYCHTRKKWLLWDGVRWKVDTCERARKMTVDMIRARQQAALDAEDSLLRQQVGKWGLASENIIRVDAALKLSQAVERFATTIDKFDADPLLATVTNGTLDLRDGSFRQSHPDDYLTMQFGTDYLPDAEAPRWKQFLQEVFGGDEELIKYIQRAVGYSLTGETKEQNIFLCYGSGANGKSVFLEVLGRLLGDYTGAASFETFNAGNKNEAGYDLAVLKGKRVVTVIETNEDRFLDEAKVKAVTGQDEISCRFLYGNFFTYRPQFKIWMAMNHKPVIRGTDGGIWRRIHLIPFAQSFEDRADKDLVTKLCAELPGILNWALEGLRDWQENGLRKPQAVREATEEYRQESDALGQWVVERTVQNQIGQLRSLEGYKDYSAWAFERGEKPFGIKSWGRYLVGRGYKHRRTNKGACYYGLELVHPNYR